MTEVFRDRRRAQSFGDVAVRYDRGRPSYPVELVEWLTGGSPGSAVDVGCGTGQVARLLTASGWDVLGVEVDERMAAVARGHGVEVVVSAFEEWAADRTDVDLICSGQAWHWIDPTVGYPKAAALLRPSGRLALFWNSYHYEPPVTEVFSRVFGRHAPELLADSVLLGTADPDHARLDAGAMSHLADSFGDPERRVFTHHRSQSVEQWLDEAPTHSAIAMLADDARQRILSDLDAFLHRATGGHLHVHYRTHLVSATRR